MSLWQWQQLYGVTYEAEDGGASRLGVASSGGRLDQWASLWGSKIPHTGLVPTRMNIYVNILSILMLNHNS